MIPLWAIGLIILVVGFIVSAEPVGLVLVVIGAVLLGVGLADAIFGRR